MRETGQEKLYNEVGMNGIDPDISIGERDSRLWTLGSGSVDLFIGGVLDTTPIRKLSAQRRRTVHV